MRTAACERCDDVKEKRYERAVAGERGARGESLFVFCCKFTHDAASAS